MLVLCTGWKPMVCSRATFLCLSVNVCIASGIYVYYIASYMQCEFSMCGMVLFAKHIEDKYMETASCTCSIYLLNRQIYYRTLYSGWNILNVQLPLNFTCVLLGCTCTNIGGTTCCVQSVGVLILKTGIHRECILRVF